MNMYFSDATHQQLYIDMQFSEAMDWTNFSIQTFQNITIDSDMYTLSMLNITYVPLSGTLYRIIIQPKGYIFLYNATITAITMDMPSVLNRSQNGRPFKIIDYGISKSIVWFVIKAPDMTDAEKQIINVFSGASDALSTVTTLPFIQ
jgi:hypothetical protein